MLCFFSEQSSNPYTKSFCLFILIYEHKAEHQKARVTDNQKSDIPKQSRGVCLGSVFTVFILCIFALDRCLNLRRGALLLGVGGLNLTERLNGTRRRQRRRTSATWLSSLFKHRKYKTDTIYHKQYPNENSYCLCNEN